ncbi:NAD(P)-binding protein [Pyrrhoderma noxium]|uniref:NAD(P)-binding protein n=1 Tax=Pyrrhoderma noxium TaxID=2282107 RepID=A0A286UGP1_9AGAM|nr:NAD(P)-binding protein [Pyrrhoderma noxium]
MCCVLHRYRDFLVSSPRASRRQQVYCIALIPISDILQVKPSLFSSMAYTVPEGSYFDYASRLKGQTVVITGAANGIGKVAAQYFASYGANVVIGDIDTIAAAKTAKEIEDDGGKVVYQACNVVNYDDLVALFDLAIKSYGRIDVVIPNAGVTERGHLTELQYDERGYPIKPSLKTLDINLISVTYATQLANHFFIQNKNADSLKRLVLIGSMASIMGIPGAPMYSASKHAILGLMRALRMEFETTGLHISTVCPWFADTAIVPAGFKLFMSGIPFVPVPKVAATIILAATDPSPESQGATYTIPDEQSVIRIAHQEIGDGVYKLLSDRVKRVMGFRQTMITAKASLGLIFGSLAFKLLTLCFIAYWGVQLGSNRFNLF